MAGVVKNQASSLKRDIMLSPVYSILFVIPFKTHDVIVDTKL